MANALCVIDPSPAAPARPPRQIAAELETIRFGDYLVERGAIDRQQLFVALTFHHRKGCRIGEAVAYFGFMEPEEVEQLAADYHGLSEIVL